MQKLLCYIGFFASVLAAQSEFCPAPDDSTILHQYAILTGDSTIKIIGKPGEEIASDVLQEKLYTQLLSEINNPRRRDHTILPENKYQLLQRCRQYYPKSIIRNDTLIIPYPPQKVDRFKEIKYFIPEGYFRNNNNFTSLQPQIQLHLNPEKSTLMINNSYLLSLYRSTDSHNNPLQHYKKVLQHVYNLLLPYTIIIRRQVKSNYNAFIHYKGYKEHNITLDSEEKFYAFWESLCGQGALYFFPSKIDDVETRIIVYGLLYVMRDDIINAYHFGELKVAFSKKNMDKIDELQLDFYPFVMNKQIGN